MSGGLYQGGVSRCDENMTRLDCAFVEIKFAASTVTGLKRIV
jgi:hypothetical protein